MTTIVPAQDRIQCYLRDHGVSFTFRHHPQAFTARQVAASEYISSDELAKPVVAIVDGRAVLVVLPGSHMLDISKLAHALNAREVRLADEKQLATIFGDCEVGAVPPFGNLYGLELYVDRSVAEHSHFEFRAGSHTATIGIVYSDFARLAQPTVIDVARPRT